MYEANTQALASVEAATKVRVHPCPAEGSYCKTGIPSALDNFHAKAEDTGGLLKLLEICVGARVMLRMNLDIGDGLVNGATGWVVDMDFHEDGKVVL